jgi:hypothetical protein
VCIPLPPEAPGSQDSTFIFEGWRLLRTTPVQSIVANASSTLLGERPRLP